MEIFRVSQLGFKQIDPLATPSRRQLQFARRPPEFAAADWAG